MTTACAPAQTARARAIPAGADRRALHARAVSSATATACATRRLCVSATRDGPALRVKRVILRISARVTGRACGLWRIALSRNARALAVGLMQAAARVWRACCALVTVRAARTRERVSARTVGRIARAMNAFRVYCARATVCATVRTTARARASWDFTPAIARCAIQRCCAIRAARAIPATARARARTVTRAARAACATRAICATITVRAMWPSTMEIAIAVKGGADPHAKSATLCSSAADAACAMSAACACATRATLAPTARSPCARGAQTKAV